MRTTAGVHHHVMLGQGHAQGHAIDCEVNEVEKRAGLDEKHSMQGLPGGGGLPVHHADAQPGGGPGQGGL